MRIGQATARSFGIEKPSSPEAFVLADALLYIARNGKGASM